VLFLLFGIVGCQLAIGFWVARRIHNSDDYLVAGRRLGFGLATASIFATWFGAESCLGAAGTAYEHGVSILTTEPFAYGLCLILLGIFFAVRLHGAGITTLADLFARRFGTSTERIAALVLLPSSLLWAAAQVRAFGHVVAANADGAMSAETGTAIAAAVAIAYTVSGGLLADVYTDVLQGAMLLLGLGVLGVAIAMNHDATAPAAATAATVEMIAGSNASRPDVLSVVEAWAIPLCGSIVAQEVLSRCLAARSPSIARRAAITGGIIYLLAGAVPLAIGALGPHLAPGLDDPEALLPHLSGELLPAALNVVFAGALISAILSTVDSCLLVAAAIVTRNLLPRPAAATEARSDRLGVARGAAAAAGLIAYGLACTSWNVKELVEQASGFGSGGVFVLAVFGVHTRIGGERAANACLLAGLATWVTCSYVVPDQVAHPYLLSLAAALGGFAIGCRFDRTANVPPRL